MNSANDRSAKMTGKRRISNRRSVPRDMRADTLQDERAIRLFGGRIVAISALLAFASCYIYGIASWGLLIGVTLGWLPSAVVAWAVASTIATFGALVFDSLTSLAK